MTFRHMQVVRRAVSALLVLALLMLCGCGEIDILPGGFGGGGDTSGNAAQSGDTGGGEVLIEDVPDWSGSPYIVINGNVPEFTKREIKRAKKVVRKGRRYEEFTELDSLGRCGSVTTVVSPETMPAGERGSIGMIKPSGWRIDKYDFIDNGGYLYNRCHLVGWQLTGLNDEERNLITGTRYMNVEGMLPFENQAAELVRGPAGGSGSGTGEAHVLYRATPVFRGKELVARGVQLEAYSLDDDGESLAYNVFCYNVQPGVLINYKNGKNRLDPETLPAAIESNEDSGEESGSDQGKDDSSGESGDPEKQGAGSSEEYPPLDIPDGVTYILNTNTMRFHRLECKGARTIREYNREWFYGTRKEAIDAGYVPCGMCEP